MIKLKDMLIKENSEKKSIFRINHQQEQEGLQFIRRFLIPVVIKIWNIKEKLFPLNEKDILENLRKLGEYRPSADIDLSLGMFATDEIEYISKVSIKSFGFEFKFKITSDMYGNIIVGFRLPISMDMMYFGLYDKKLRVNIISENMKNFNTKLQNLNEEDIHTDNKTPIIHNITKMEEQYAFQKIKQIWSKVYGKEFGKSLKKIKDNRQSYGDQYNVVVYKAIVNGKTEEFRIIKNRKGVSVGRVDHGGQKYSTAVNWIRIIDSAPITEGIEGFWLSKKDEQYGLNYLTRKLMPQILEKTYNDYLKKYPNRYQEENYPRITEKDIIKNLKKLRYDVDSVSYESVINDDISFAFHIQKKDYGLVIGAQGPIDINWTFYQIRDKSTLQENTTISKSSISRQEEHQALDFIKKKMIPRFVNFNNEMAGEYGTSKITTQELLKTLKKTDQRFNDPEFEDIVVYKITYQNQPYKFMIFKSNNKLSIHDTGDGTAHTVK